MTNERKPCPGKTYKRVFVKEAKGSRWYTQCEMNEHDYMGLSNVWAKLRREKLRANPVCEHCQSGINVQVHHIRYPDVWGEEQMEDLMTLCDECHKGIHRVDIERRKEYVANT